MADERQLLELDISVDPSDYKEDLEKIFAVIRPKWSNIVYKKCPGSGVVNLLLLVSEGHKTSDAVVVRVWNDVLDTVVKRDREMAATRVFNERGLTPEIYCVFKNGICMKFIQGRRFDWDELDAEPLRDEKIFKAAGREFAKYHSKKTSDLAIQKFGYLLNPSQSEMTRVMDDLMTKWPPKFSHDKETEELFNEKFPSKSLMIEDWKRIKETLEESGVPVVLCHHDGHPSNALYVAEEDRVYMIDYEMSSFDYATMDLATFLEFSATGLIHINAKPSRRHPMTLRKIFYREYLETLRKLGDLDHDVTELDVERLHVQTEKSVLAMYMYDTYLCLNIAAEPREQLVPPKAFLEVALDEMEWVKSNKEKIIAMKTP